MNDPFYQFNPTDVWARNGYYDNYYTPHLYIDGNIDGAAGYNSWGGMINSERQVNSELVINLSGIYMADSAAGYVTVRIITETDPGLGNCKLRLSIVENNIEWNAPNGLTRHEQVFRGMFPSTFGQAVTLIAGDTLEYTFRFMTSAPMAPGNCLIVAFVQSDYNHRVAQAAKIKITDLQQTGIDDDIDKPSEFTLSQNYPNPFNSQTRIDFNSKGGAISLDIFDLSGARVARLFDGKAAPGPHSVIWDGRDDRSEPVSSGTYFYRLNGPNGSKFGKMVLLK